MQTPNDCALLFTVPLDERNFLSDLHKAEKDFVKNWAENQRLASDENLTDAALWTIYSKKVRDFVLRAADEIASLGVAVFFDTRRGDLTEIFRQKKVVTLEAHWFSPKLELNDFYNPADFIENLRESSETVAKALRHELFSGDFEKFGFAEIVENINKLFSNYNAKHRPPEPIFIDSDGESAKEEIWIHLNRFALEKTFPGAIKSRCRIEMFNELCALEDFAREIPHDFGGVLDLTVCNSEIAGRNLKQVRRDLGLVMTNRFVTDLKLRLILYKGAIKLLESGACESYVDAVFALRKQLLETNRREK